MTLAARALLFALAPLATTAHAGPPAAASSPAPTPSASAAIESVFAGWDSNHDGQLTREEFRRGWTALHRRLEVEAGLKAQFARLDADHSGAINAGEYSSIALARRAGAAAPMSRFDANHDQQLDFVEYVRLVQALAPTATTSGR